MAGPQTPFVKQLVSSDKRIREDAFESLRTFLSARREMSETDLMKLWKGLFYCMWMTDKPRVQQRMAADLGDLIEILPEDARWPFIDAFWKTMVREWHGIDRLRLEKFLLLARFYLRHCFQLLADSEWEEATIQRLNTILSEGPMSPSNSKTPVGLTYHLLDIYLEELSSCRSDQESTQHLPMTLEPIRILATTAKAKSMRLRAKGILEEASIPQHPSTAVEEQPITSPPDVDPV